MRFAHLLFASLLLSAACGDDQDGTGAAGGGTTTSGATGTTGSQSTTSSSTTTSATTTGSSSSSTGAGGGDCPDISCTEACDDGYWDDLEGCQTCACAPPPGLELSVQGVAKNPQHLSFDVAASELIGGIDRWVFDFTWTYDDPQTSDDEEIVSATVRLMKLGPQYEPSESNVTWYSPGDDGMPLEMLGGDYTLYGFAVLTDTLAPAGGYISIRRVGAFFEGGVVLEMQGSGVAGMVHAAAPFTVAVP